MTTQDTGFDLELTRRKLLAAAGIAGGAAVAASLVGTGAAQATPAPFARRLFPQRDRSRPFGGNLAASKLLTPRRMPILRSASWHFGY